jgi:hypothetical protein
MAVGGFAALKALLNFFLSTNVTWVVTAFPILLRGRRYAYAIFALGLVAEFAAIWYADGAPSLERDGVDAIGTVRFFTRLSAVAAVILSSFVACFVHPKREASSLTMDEVVISRMDFAAQLNESAPTDVSRRVRGPRIAAKHYTPTSIKFGKDTDSSISVSTNENVSFINSNRFFVPNKRRSKSSNRSSVTGVAVPVVTPMKPRVGAVDSFITAPDCDRDFNTKFSHRHDANTKEYGKANRQELENVRLLIQNGGEEMSGSSSDESSYVGSTLPAKTRNKRTTSDLYSSSDDESHFFSANDYEVSTMSTLDYASRMKRPERKKPKLINA